MRMHGQRGFGAAIQVKPDFQTVLHVSLAKPFQAVHIQKQKLLRETEILEQQQITGKGPGRIGYHPFIIGKPHGVQAIQGQFDLPRSAVLVEETQFQVAEVVEQQFIKMKDMLVGAIQIKSQGLPSDFGKTQVVKTLQPYRNHLLAPLTILCGSCSSALTTSTGHRVTG